MNMIDVAPLSPLFLGIDTGGTYTDAVLWREDRGIVAKAKALTTRYDLAVGISAAVDAILTRTGTDPRAIKLVSMSTTLATNALVEGQGERAALVLIGFEEADLQRAGLKAALNDDPVLFCPGGHDVFGNASPLDLALLEAHLPRLGETVSAIAVCGMFAVRNPAHEIAARDLIRAHTGLPVTTSHELSAKLGGPKRALTTLLNARLISMIDRLIMATEGYLNQRGIVAPLMVVRGDGALVSANFAKSRPIETILSGPAASLVGARHMCGLDNAIASDMGGTTTDVAVLDAGKPRLDPEGASVGGFRTMVEAVAMRTFGLGGDSEVSVDFNGFETKLRLGPRRLIPLSLAAMLHGEAIRAPLKRQLQASHVGRFDGRFVMRSGIPDRLAAGLRDSEAALYAVIESTPKPLDAVLSSVARNAVLARLVAQGLVQIIGFTPSDAAHVLGRQTNWDADAALMGADLFCRQKDNRGQPLAPSPQSLAERVLAQMTRRSAEVILETAFAEDGLDGAPVVAHALVQRAIEGRSGIARFSVALDRPVIGLGASAGLHYAGLPALVGNECVVPDDADVANALGAVVGQVSVRAEAQVSQPVDGIFRVSVGTEITDYQSEDEAIAAAERSVRQLIDVRAEAAGADAAHVEVTHDLRAAMVEGRRTFVEAAIIAIATGRPRIAADTPP
jgi:N-methylhydantoinase A/oxoprolinase/acetone carboxylase beta subunit